jgi:hypothetical protein
MTLLDAKELDPEQARKRKKQFMVVIVLVTVFLLIGVLGALLGYGWWFRYFPEERIVGRFFATLQHQDYKTAYGIWMHDPNWSQHPQNSTYPFNDFYRDWGPGGQWGLIKTAKVYGASTCPGPSTGVVVDVIVNDRAEHAQVWVEKSDHTLSFPPCELLFR